MKIFCFLLSLYTRSIVLNPEHSELKTDIDILKDGSIEKGKGLGTFKDLRIDLNDDQEIKKFLKLAKLEDVPEGMAEIAQNIEKFVTDEIQELKKGERFFVIYFVDEETALYPADHPNDGVRVFVSTDEELAKSMNTPFPGVYGFNPRDKVAYQFPLTSKIIKNISSIIKVDLIGMLTYQNIELYKSTGLHSYYVFLKQEDIESFPDKFMEEARRSKHTGKFCLIPYQGDRVQLSTFGLTEEDLPALLFLDDGDKFPLKKCLEKDVAKFVQDVKDRKIDPVFVSENEPENNEELEVRVITRNNLNDYKSETSKDRLLVFSSPHCGHCTDLRPILERLGSIAKKNFADKFAIGSCDITINDIAGFDISSVPKIFFFKAETNEMIKFENMQRTLENFVNFIRDTGTFNLDMNPFLEEKTVSKESAVESIPIEKPAEGRDL
jgi:protein disulfide-isomerase A1